MVGRFSHVSRRHISKYQSVTTHKDSRERLHSTIQPFEMPFEYARSITGNHLVVQPSDARLNPPESYLFVQDFLIVSCGVLYAFCYFFYMLRTVRDKTLAGPVEYLSADLTM